MKQLQYGCKQKLVIMLLMFYFVLAVPVLIIMYTDKDSNLISEQNTGLHDSLHIQIDNNFSSYHHDLAKPNQPIRAKMK